MTKEQARKFRIDLEKTLSTLGKEYGVTLEMGNMMLYADGNVKFSVSGVDSKYGNKYAKDYILHCERFNFKPEWLDKVIVLEKYGDLKLLGFNYGNKYGVALKTIDDQIVFYREDVIRKACSEQLK